MVTPRKLCAHCNSGVDSAKGMDLHMYLRGTHALKFKRFLLRNVKASQLVPPQIIFLDCVSDSKFKTGTES